MSDVPCNGCVRCCINDLVRILPGEDESKFKTFDHPLINGAKALQHKQNGECIYMSKTGCTIHDNKPLMCKEMDCRNIASALTYTKARKLNILRIWEKGKELINEK